MIGKYLTNRGSIVVPTSYQVDTFFSSNYVKPFNLKGLKAFKLFQPNYFNIFLFSFLAENCDIVSKKPPYCHIQTFVKNGKFVAYNR